MPGPKKITMTGDTSDSSTELMLKNMNADVTSQESEAQKLNTSKKRIISKGYTPPADIQQASRTYHPLIIHPKWKMLKDKYDDEPEPSGCSCNLM